jgi:hypothetical protein
MTPQTKIWSAESGRYVDIDLAMTTFGPLKDFCGLGEPEGFAEFANDNEDRGPYIGTFSGKFWPFAPRAEDVRLDDIAHHLSQIPRYGGAMRHAYSVAEHSVHIARWLLPRHGPTAALYGLLHDAPEAVSGFGDVQRPTKSRVPIIGEIENKIWFAVAEAFGLAPAIPECVHVADNRIIADEMAQGMCESDVEDRVPLGVTIEFWPPEIAEIYFLDMFRLLEIVEDGGA